MTNPIQEDRWGLLNPSKSPKRLIGRIEPRLWTPPLRELTPETSYGFDVCDFAKEDLGSPLRPWQEWLVIHAGEELPDGSPRFKRVLVLVSRQNGKTFVLVVLTLYWMFGVPQPIIFGTSTNVFYAKESWGKALDIAEGNPELAERINTVRRAAGETEFNTTDKSRYLVGAANRRGGRGLAINRLVADEIREHDSFDAYNAAWPACSPWDAQAWFIGNQGDDNAVVLDFLRKEAIKFIETEGREGDPRLGLFEWSAPDGADMEDIEALAQGNPNLGVGEGFLQLDELLAEARQAKAGTLEAQAGFRVEKMCMRVPKLDAAIDPAKWSLLGTDKPIDLAEHRDRVALCVDVALDGSQAALIAAAEVEGRIHLESVAAWTGEGCTAALRRELPGYVRKIRPRVVGWFPNGPAARIAASLKNPKQPKRGAGAWPPPGVKIEEIRTEVPAVCMGFSDLVESEEVVHPDDELITTAVTSAEKLWTGKTWVFKWNAEAPVNAAYAAAGAAHLARTLPPSLGKPRLVISKKN